MGYNSFQSFVRKNPFATAAATIALGAATVFVIKAPITGLAPTGAVRTLLLQTGSGVTVGQCYDNGSCRFSGSLVTRSNLSGSTLNVDGTTRMGSGLIISRTKDIGWPVIAGANTACNTTCVQGCVFGVDTASLVADIVDCADATADECLCAGNN